MHIPNSPEVIARSKSARGAHLSEITALLKLGER